MANPTDKLSPRYLTTILICILLGSCARVRPAAEYDRAWSSFASGDLSRAVAQAAAGTSAWRGRPDSPWFWSFHLLEAEARAAQSQRKEAEALLKDPLPARPELAQLEVRRLILLASLGTRPRTETNALLARARASVKDPELSVRLALIEGVVAYRQGRVAEAHAAYRAGADAALRLGNLYLQAQAFVNLSHTAKTLQRYEESAEVGLRALQIAEKIGARRIAAAAHGNLGSTYAYLGDFGPAFAHERKAIQIFESIGAKMNLMIALGELGLMHDRREELQPAIANYQRAYDLARELRAERDAARHAENLSTTLIRARQWDAAAEWNRRASEMAAALQAGAMQPYLQRNRAWIAYGRGRPEEAAAICREALRENAGVPGTRWPLHALLGLIDSDAGRFLQAERSFEKALEIIEGTRTDLLKSHYRITLLSRLIPFYRSYVEVLLKRNDNAGALRVVESSRARVLSERMERDLEPRAFPGVARFQSFARANRAALLSFWLTPSRSYAWLTTAGGVRRFDLPPEEHIAALVKRYRGIVEHSLQDPIAASEPSGPALWKTLMAGVAAAIPRGTRVIVIPDGVLHQLNLETLVVPGPRPHYWIEDVEVALCPSMTIAASAPPAGSRPGGPVLLIGAPDYTSTPYPPLKNAAAELRGIQAHFNGRGQQIYTGAQASPAVYRQAQPARFSFIHFAAHAEANPERPMESAVVLSRDKEQYKLLARDVVDVPIHANLVTLSACRSAGANTYAGEGLVGFAWAFLQAGARAVTAGLWDVSDSSTEQLMVRFYAALASGKDPVAALHDAKLALLRGGPEYRKPYFWAPFQVYLGSAVR